MTPWDCAVCGAENQQETCWLCGRPPAPLESEEVAAAALLHAAELEFSRALGMPIQLQVLGGHPPRSVEEARILIAEMREHVAEQLEGDEPSGYGLVTYPEPDRWGS